MCKFFSCVSDGKGKTLFFTLEECVKIMSEGNKENFIFNSHTSIMCYNNIKGLEEDKWNKWEYDVDNKKLKVDSLVTTNDSKKVKKIVEEYLKEKDIIFLRNFYGNNSGDENSGYGNSGDENSGDGNSGNRNSGSFNTDEPFIRLFNKDSNWKWVDFYNHESFNIINRFDLISFISYDVMTEKEKKGHLDWQIIGGYLKTNTYKEAWKIWRTKISDKEIEIIKSIPNFDSNIFEEITGLKI